MYFLSFLSDLGPATLVVAGVAAFLFVVFMFVGIWASRYTKVGPNQVLVISGRKNRILEQDGTARDVGFRIVKGGDRKSTRLNSSHTVISYAVFCLKKKKENKRALMIIDELI